MLSEEELTLAGGSMMYQFEIAADGPRLLYYSGLVLLMVLDAQRSEDAP